MNHKFNVKSPTKINEFDGVEGRYTAFQNLMRQRVHEILLVSSMYDSFILAQDGQLNELVLNEFVDLNLYQAPAITRTSGAEDALNMLEHNQRFDLIITTMHVGDMDFHDFARALKDMGLDIPLVLLTYEARELQELQRLNLTDVFEKVFLWQGDFRILLAIVKYIEDRLNVDHDTEVMGVQVIVIAEDNIGFYSSYLPLIYTEVMNHSQNLLAEGLNLAHKILRMRARPKILLCETFEEALHYYNRFEKYVLGVITDIEFLREGKKDPEAGARFARLVKSRRPDIPVLLQSFRPAISRIANKLGINFIRKDSPTLLHDLRSFMIENFGFGNFIFRMPDGSEVDSAGDLHSLEEKLKIVSEESVRFHGERDHFSRWLKARTEFLLANKLKPRKVSDYPSIEALRQDLIHSLHDFRRERAQGLVLDFQKDIFDPEAGFARIGVGSLGGKARGLAFINHFLNRFRIEDKFKGVKIIVPPTVVLCTDAFDAFMESNQLIDFAVQSENEKKILECFLAAEFPEQFLSNLVDLVDLMPYPLAVRSSSLLEDSQYQPFAGVYSTFMLPNNHPDPAVRLRDLLDAIKRIYASVYANQSKRYINATPYRLEEEKMAVIIQRLVGSEHNTIFYPDISGVARSFNFYPKPPLKSTDGIVSVALGLGETVVTGEQSFRFCPKYPRHAMQFASVADFVDNSQKKFYALDLEKRTDFGKSNQVSNLRSYELDIAERDGSLNYVGSVYSAENDAVYDGLSRDGLKLISFAPILKHDLFPLPDVISHLLDLGKWGMGEPVEIEFAVDLSKPKGDPGEFAILQMRPMVLGREFESLEFGEIDSSDVICQSDKVMGFGKIEDIYDLVYVDIARFNRNRSLAVAKEVTRLNSRLITENRPYALIGIGRWGSADPWLGIPVTWDQISGSRVIVEAGFKDVKVVPSEGAHFFHNLISFQIGYFTIEIRSAKGILDWDWLARQKAVEEGKFVRLLRFTDPIVVKMNGYRNQGIILKPSVSTQE